MLCWQDWVRTSDIFVNSEALLPTELHASITYYIKLGTLRQIRTVTAWLLKPVPLPIGLRGH